MSTSIGSSSNLQNLSTEDKNTIVDSINSVRSALLEKQDALPQGGLNQYLGRDPLGNLVWSLPSSGSGSIIHITAREGLSGHTVTFAMTGMDTVSLDIPSEAPYVLEITTPILGTLRVTDTVTSESFTIAIDKYSYYTSVLEGRFPVQAWADSAGLTGTYTDLEDLFSLESNVRTLFTMHDSVDFLNDRAGVYAYDDIVSIFSNDYCIKWINLRDYALNTFIDNPFILEILESVDKYGYGEYSLQLVPLIPTLTSDRSESSVTLSGSATSEGYEAWRAFNESETGWRPLTESSTSQNIVFTFSTPVCVEALEIVPLFRDTDSVILYPNDSGTSSLLSDSYNRNTDSDYLMNVSNSNSSKVYRLTESSVPTVSAGFSYLQLYKRDYALRGAIPRMTDANNPYCKILSGPQDAYKLFNDRPYEHPQDLSDTPVIYAFMNPVRARGFSLKPTLVKLNGETVPSASKVEVYGSKYDPLEDEWVLLGSQTYTSSNLNEVFTHIDNSLSYDAQDYYMYYKVVFTPYEGVTNCTAGKFQLYGRELKPLVPTMGGSTLCGSRYTAIADSSHSLDAYKPYDRYDSTSLSYSIAPGSSGYTKLHIAQSENFVALTPVCYSLRYDLSRTSNVTITVAGTCDPSGLVIIDNEIHSSGMLVDSELDEKLYEISVEVSNTGSDSLSCVFQSLQFYGYDYEEHQERHWVYDHGLEFDDIVKYNVVMVEGPGTATEYVKYLTQMNTGSSLWIYARRDPGANNIIFRLCFFLGYIYQGGNYIKTSSWTVGDFDMINWSLGRRALGNSTSMPSRIYPNTYDLTQRDLSFIKNIGPSIPVQSNYLDVHEWVQGTKIGAVIIDAYVYHAGDSPEDIEFSEIWLD